MALMFQNSLTRQKEAFTPIVPGKVGLYTCGPTVYNFAHIGNFRAYVFEDLLKRTLCFCGYDVHHVMNLTDVDDKTIRDSKAEGTPLRDFTQRYKDAFFEDVDTLMIDRADVYPAATDHVAEMIEIVQTLCDKGNAYQANDGSVYFSIETFPSYGQLVRIDQENLRPGTRVKLDEYEKDAVADFALWKAYDEGDGDVAWDSPWGKGRPGWHIECSAMSMKYLGETFDIHCGGVDNMFPHHEDEIAQSEAANGCKFVNYWLHNAHLVVEGKKMSKSLGNFYTLRDLFERGFSGREIRWVLLNTHYRQLLNFSFDACENARAALQRLDDFVVRLKEAALLADAGEARMAERLEAAEAGFRGGLEDDLNISVAVAALFDFVRDTNKGLDDGSIGGATAQKALDLLSCFDSVLAVLSIGKGDDVPADVLAMVEDRQAARKARDFARADALRDELAALGWVIEDTAQGARVKRG
ncbi:MAG: cysteine--tRNA ligase [Lentisphaerae bacterium]|jgi:cysteinyl-tRNA synthetase|nr:cysteine--tRNA ligase [Lentisphaerota bacterium]MBT4818008.1 cysteine--tRNA ligase [Lentisphaerota bacterium]MBT5607255.1 cysteine--tRNA ligase [Lentisphaerota bacterium]MBT7058816.1 cysteine--tRNA ligase [Lentisphaerota bacterium]MBT7842374.1 cysteine--tRNA ligase [Lentisphaerota bacterium]